MPKLQRHDYYDVARDMNWDFTYVSDKEVFPEELSKSFGIENTKWWGWDEPYKLTYRESVGIGHLTVMCRKFRVRVMFPRILLHSASAGNPYERR